MKKIKLTPPTKLETTLKLTKETVWTVPAAQLAEVAGGVRYSHVHCHTC